MCMFRYCDLERAASLESHEGQQEKYNCTLSYSKVTDKIIEVINKKEKENYNSSSTSNNSDLPCNAGLAAECTC